MVNIEDFRINNDRFDEGYGAGEEDGYDKGFQTGFAGGREVGFEEGLAAALRAPRNNFFAAGYKAGVADTQRLPQATYQEGWDAGFEMGYQARTAESDDE